MAYQQHDQNISCFSSLDSALKALKKLVAVNAIATRMYSSLTSEILDKVMVANAIMKDKKGRKRDQYLCYKLEHWRKISTFDILNHISKYM